MTAREETPEVGLRGGVTARKDVPEAGLTGGAPLLADDFAPLPPRKATQRLARPARSFLGDVWSRLRKNPQAFASLWIILGLLLFAAIGPTVWPVDPAAQSLDRLSEPPGPAPAARVIEPVQPWAGVILPDRPAQTPTLAAELPAPANLRLTAEATTEAVRLIWDPVDGASGYRVYRNEHRPRSIVEAGLPLRDILAGNRVGYQDRLRLAPMPYFYSVAATDGAQESTRFALIEVHPRRAIDLRHARLQEPDATPGQTLRLTPHPLGTDYLGRDMLARLMHGARTSLLIGLGAPLLFVPLGMIYGALAGYAGGRIDDWMMRFADFVIALPFLLFMILLRVAFGIQSGESGIAPLTVALLLMMWPGPARLVRGEILRIREAGHVQAARLMGAGPLHILLRHLLPNAMGVTLVSLTFAVPSAIFTEAFLSFIGMGVVPPTPSWGAMCQEGIRSMLTHPHELILPAALISLTALAFNLFGDGLRDALDVRMRGTP